MNWKKLAHNEILEIASNAYVSYNPTPSMSDEGPETALVLEKDGKRKFFILTGDFRREYEEAITRDGIGGALAFFEANQDKLNGWSDGQCRGVLNWLAGEIE